MKKLNTKVSTEKGKIANDPLLSVFFMFDRGVESFCDNHITRYWKAVSINLKRFVQNHIIHYENDLTYNKKYHCYIDYSGCIGERFFDTDNFKEAVNWINERLKNYR